MNGRARGQGTPLSEPSALQGWESWVRTDTGGRETRARRLPAWGAAAHPTVLGPCSVEGARQLALHWVWGYGVEGKVEPQDWGLWGEGTVLSEAGSTLSSWLR